LPYTTLFRSSPSADTVVVDARIYTVNSKQPWAQALAIRGGKIVAIGSAKQIEVYRAASTKVLDGKGYLLLPGFTDSHIHFLDGSLSLLRVNLSDAKTIPEFQKLVRDYEDKNPRAPWVLGRGCQHQVS